MSSKRLHKSQEATTDIFYKNCTKNEAPKWEVSGMLQSSVFGMKWKRIYTNYSVSSSLILTS